MITIPELIKKEWSNKQDAIVLTTVSEAGIPNSIYATQAALFNDNKVLIANNKFKKTLENIENSKKVTVLFITKETKSYQLKGSVCYKTEGDEFNDMKKWNRADLPGYGVAVVEVQEIFSGAEKIV
ncbi:pyridoxamine 5'-phosphate oxidase family protein [Carboxylicivirga caseinilyticus]|uniref:pyridoxamine 5'-phosphate oxidase family protein n=1 Tax=Carboxylicivirga caseinilyticus TaxID=3417572 RepID=UPI0029C6C5FF|nr:pyridoxamine 5'-phosphate oxidase family protein [uncultured Carboxylicivirga sp.]MCU4164351.1 pyridoxamine 5'-phosphate oxidase family protein [Marinilabiliaceae bacterium A049]